jgi:hypothetical protein
MKRGLKETIGISCEALSEKYLGLPRLWGGLRRGLSKIFRRDRGARFTVGKVKVCQWMEREL